MISRRSFLLGVGYGFVLPRFFDRALALYEDHGEALLEAPPQVGTTIFASQRYTDSFQLLLGDPAAEPPRSMTLREYVERYGGFELESAEEEWEMALDDQMSEEWIFDAWCLNDSPNARAYRLLDSLDLGFLRDHQNKVGEIEFIQGPCPGNDYTGVEAATELDLSLLQDQLNQIGARVRIEICA